MFDWLDWRNDENGIMSCMSPMTRDYHRRRYQTEKRLNRLRRVRGSDKKAFNSGMTLIDEGNQQIKRLSDEYGIQLEDYLNYCEERFSVNCDNPNATYLTPEFEEKKQQFLQAQKDSVLDGLCINNRIDQTIESLVKEGVGYISRIPKLPEKVKEYLVDCTATSLFYNTLFLANETLIAGMEWDEIGKSRALGTLIHYTLGRVQGKARDYMARLTHTNEDSSAFRKFASDTLASLMVQVPCYTTVVYLSGADAKEMATAVGVGALIGMSTGRPFGYFQDKFRSLCGSKPAIESDKNVV
ncbi:MAG: L-alanine exporter AlaE [Candidatus Woesearchaeota archaeon]